MQLTFLPLLLAIHMFHIFFYDETRKGAWMKDNALRLLERTADALSLDARNHCNSG